MPDQTLVRLGTLLVFAGILLAFLALSIPRLRPGRRPTQGGAVVVIGPIPIVIATDRGAAKALLGLAMILVTLLLVLFILQV